MIRRGPYTRARNWIALGVLALAVRALALEMALPVGLVGDEFYYVDTAVQLASGQGHYNPKHAAYAAWPPAQAWLLSQFVDASHPPGSRQPESLAPLQRASVIVGSLLPLFVVLLGRELFGARTGWIAGVVAALYPEFIAYSHYLWAENLFTLLVTAGLWLAVRARPRGAGWVAAAGVCFGAATLAREEGLVIAAACGLWWLLSARPWTLAAPRAALLLAIVIASVAPWSIRNYRVLDRIVPVSTSGWMGAMEGNAPGQPWLRQDMQIVRELRERYNAIPNESQRLDFSRSEALHGIAAEQPEWLAKKLLRNLPQLLAPDSFVLKKLNQGAYGDLGIAARRIILVATSGACLAITALALLGVAASDPVRRRLPLLVGGAVIAVHVLANASSRYRLPLMPLAIVYASHFVNLPGGVRSAFGGRAGLGVGIALLLLLASLALFIPDFIDFWSRGEFADPLRP